MNGSVDDHEQRLDSFRKSLHTTLEDAANLGEWRPMARMYHRRQVGKLFFFDTLMVDPTSKESFLVELVCCDESGRSRDGFETLLEGDVTLKDLRPGDVLEIQEARLDPCRPRAPCHLALKALRMRRCEAWLELFGTVAKPEWMPAKYGFHRPVFHDAVNQSWFEQLDVKQQQKRDEKKHLARNEENTAEGQPECVTEQLPQPEEAATTKVGPEAPNDYWSTGLPRYPSAVLQCHLPQAERLASYLGGKILSPGTRDRLVMLYSDTQTGSIDLTRLMEGHLQSIIQRIYQMDTRQKGISLRQASQQYLLQLLGPPSADPPQPGPESLWEFLRRARNFMSFPRELEDTLKPLVDASPWGLEFSTRPATNGYTSCTGGGNKFEALILPKDRCDTVVYADGLFWWMCNSPRTIVPARDGRMVPSGAYWKLLEILERYDPPEAETAEGPERSSKDTLAHLYHGRRLAMDIGASPGGWSYCLAKELKTQQVLAVDPAAYMHPLVRNLAADDVRDEFVKDFTKEELKEDAKNLKHLDEASESWRSESQHCGNIRQWRLRGQDGLNKLKAEPMKLALFVCDMNDELESSCELLYRVFNEKLYDPPCLAVVTFKNTCKSKAEFQSRKSAMIRKVVDDGVLTKVQELHLFANTRMETTIVGQML